MKWTTKNIASQKGRIAIVTGTGGLGFEDALALARAGTDVIIAGRNTTKGEDAVSRIQQEVPGASIRFEQVDLASLVSIAEFGKRLRGQLDHLDILINNAGVMTPPDRRTTTDNFELQFGTNYLGHFALTAELLPLLIAARGRVVSLGSVAARRGKLNFADLQYEKSYVPMTVYAQSKLACVMFALELQRHSEENSWGITSVAAHPGISRTDLIPNGSGSNSLSGRARRLAWFAFQPAAQGALPTLFAATSANIQPGAYYGPDGLSEVRGYPKRVAIPAQALDKEAARKLWEVSVELTNAQWPV